MNKVKQQPLGKVEYVPTIPDKLLRLRLRPWHKDPDLLLMNVGAGVVSWTACSY